MSKRDVRAARMLINSRLRWLEGYPASQGSGWITVRGRTIDLTRRRLRRATRAIGELLARYPHTLGEIFADDDDWITSVQTLIEHLKPHVHDGESLPANLFTESSLYPTHLQERATSIAAANPGLRRPVEVLSWSLGTKPKRARSVLSWLEGSSELVATIVAHQDAEWASAAVARLAAVVSLDGKRSVGPIEELLAMPLFHTLAPPDAFQGLTHALVWSLRLKRGERRRYFRLIDEIRFDDVLNAWLGRSTNEARATQLPQNTLRLFADSLVECAWLSKRGDLYRPVVSILGQIPRGQAKAGWGLHLLMRWVGLAKWGLSNGVELSVEPVLRRLSQHLESCSDPGDALSPWFEAATEENARLDWVLMMASDVDSRPFFEALSDLESAAGSEHNRSRAGRVDRSALEVLAQLTVVVDDPVDLAELIRHWTTYISERNPYVETRIAKVAFEISAGALSRFWPLYAVLEEQLVGGQSLTALEHVVGFNDGELIACVRELLTPDDINTVLEVGLMLYRLAALGAESFPGPPGLTASRPEWADHYPTEFAPALAALASVTPDAERLTDRVLRRHLPRPDHLRTQINALRLRSQTASNEDRASMQIRIENLEARINAAHRLGAGQTDRLKAKLLRAAARARLEAWASALRKSFRTAFAEKFGLSPDTEWLGDERLVSLAPYLIFSEPSQNDLVCKLLAEREGSPPWDFRDHPANRRFVEGMTANGIDMNPWLNGIEAPSVLDRQGRRVQMSLEIDPLEIFNMGRPFDTCLSPGEPFFSSVLANAADINKRVIMARRSDGTLVGRCLIALTDDGAIISFYPYCTDPELTFRSMVWEVVQDLCVRMGTQYRPYSHRYKSDVSVLVAKYWLDDGPTDISGVFDDESNFRDSLREVSPDEIHEWLATQLPEGGVLELYLPSLLRLPEIAQRPELVTALFPQLLGAASTLPIIALADAALLLTGDGQVELAARLLIPRSRELRRGSQADMNQLLNHAAARIVANRDPSTILRLLRSTRRDLYFGKRVTEWEEEFPTRAALAAVALESLSRRSQAMDVWRSVANQNPIGVPKDVSGELHKEAELNIARLAGSIVPGREQGGATS